MTITENNLYDKKNTIEEKQIM